jgi:hypothetical protein
MTIIEILEKARAIHAEGSYRWTRKYFATTAEGIPVADSSTWATRWDMLGAIGRASQASSDSDRRRDACSVLRACVPNGNLMRFTETATYEQVMAAWDAAIAKARRIAAPARAA